jgi:hypothetical protein
MLGSDINQKPLIRTYYSRYLKKCKLSLYFLMGLLNSYANYTKHIPILFLTGT